MAQQEPPSNMHFPVVGIGASAGGLQALEVLFRGLPERTGAAFVVVTHMDPGRPNHLVDILSGFTPMPVREAAVGAPLAPDEVLVIPPGAVLTVEGGAVRLRPALGRELPHLVDLFLGSLAKEQGNRSFGIILSGSGSDGVAGLRAIHEAGGVIIVQDAGSASHSGMPLSAAAAGVADLVLPLAEIPARLAAHLQTAAQIIQEAGGGDSQLPEDDEGQVNRLLGLLRAKSGHDFSVYKINTLVRRIQKRMLLANVSSVARYVTMVEGEPGEYQALFHDLFIGVTRFFRDADAFEALRRLVLPEMFKGKEPGDTLRIWVAGCSTGEEAYSVAVLAAEYMEAARRKCAVKILATDIDGAAIEKARQGSYPAAALEDMPVALAAKHFTAMGQERVARPEIRDMIVFARHDILRDPPFFRLDLVVCRNLLIYLKPEAQKKVLSLFFHALNDGGHLFMGPSENLGMQAGLFAEVDRKWRIFRRTAVGGRLVGFPLPLGRQLPLEQFSRASLERRSQHTEVAGVLEKALADRYSRAAALIDAEMSVLRFHGDTSPFLDLPQGEPTTNIIKLAKRGLRLQLRASIRQAAETGRPVEARALRLAGDRLVNLIVEPLGGGAGSSSLSAVIFEEAAPGTVLACDAAGPMLTESALVARLEDELRAAREQLQEALDGFDAVNEEVRSSNEELMSMNEELQSSYEELETSREELQALNEELSIVNSELQQKVEELGEANCYLENLFRSTNVATIFLDRSLRILRFTPAASELFQLIDTDVGRPITDITSSVPGLRIQEQAGAVLDTGALHSQEVETTDGRWFQARMRPYRVPRGSVDGVVLTLVDVSGLKDAQEALRRVNEGLEQRVEQRTRELAASEARFRAIFEQAAAGIAELDLEGRFLRANDRYCALAGRPCHELLGMNFRDIVHPDDLQADTDQLRMLLSGEGETFTLEKRYVRPDGSVVWVSLTRSRVRPGEGLPDYLVAVAQDVTDRRSAEEQARSQALFPEQNPNPVLRFDNDGNLLYANAASQELIHHCPVHGSARPDKNGMCQCRNIVRQSLKAGLRQRDEVVAGDKTFLLTTAPIPEKGYINVYGMDVTPLKQAQTAQRLAMEEAEAQREQLRVLLESLPQVSVVRLDADLRYRYVSPNIPRLFNMRVEDYLGRRPTELGIDDDLSGHLEDLYRRALEERREVSLQHGFSTPAGGRHRIFRAAPDIVDGRVRSVIAVSYDISDLKKLESDLRLSKQEAEMKAAQLQAVFDNLSEGLFTLDAAGRLTMNAAGARLLGFDSPEDAISELVRYPEHFELWDASGTLLDFDQWPLPRVMRGERIRDQVIEVRRTETGRTYTANHNAVPVLDQDGNVVLAVLTVTDVTAVRESERRLQLALESVRAGIWEWDLRTGRNYWTDELCRVYGLQPEACVPSYDAWLASIHPDDRETAAGVVSEAVASEAELRCEWRTSDGQDRWIMARGMPIRNVSGTVVRYLGIAMDITDRKRMEDGLRQAKRAAEAANLAKSEFLANMSHEIRNPMNGVLGMTELALTVSREHETQEYLQLARHSARHLMDILGDILDFSRIEAGGVILDPQRFSLHTMLNSVLGSLAVSARGKGLSLETDIGADVPDIVVGDQVRLRQIIINLVSNAIKFTEQGGIFISAAAAADPDLPADAVRLAFRVRDTGIGIADKDAATIFEKFTHIQSPAHVRHGGTGLGLAISRGLAERMGGSISVASAVGQGSEFFFDVVMRLPQGPALGERQDAAPAGGVGEPLRILIAEDDPINSKVIAAFLEMKGHSAAFASTGREALQALAREAFDLVLMDVRMPVMDGEEATQVIRRSPPQGVNPDVPIIALTAHALKEDRERFLALGMNDYLSKPVNLEELHKVILLTIVGRGGGAQ